jgi:hypothetical protein
MRLDVNLKKILCAFEFSLIFGFLSILKSRLYGILTRFFGFLGRIIQLDKGFRLRYELSYINEKIFLPSFHHLRGNSPPKKKL